MRKKHKLKNTYDLEEWLIKNNYELETLVSGDQGIFINAKDRTTAFKFLEDRDLIKDWDYRGDYKYILVTLKEGE